MTTLREGDKCLWGPWGRSGVRALGGAEVTALGAMSVLVWEVVSVLDVIYFSQFFSIFV